MKLWPFELDVSNTSRLVLNDKYISIDIGLKYNRYLSSNHFIPLKRAGCNSRVSITCSSFYFE